MTCCQQKRQSCCSCFESTRPRCVEPSHFRMYYERGDLPVKVECSYRISWKVQIEMLDYAYYLPIFLDGLVECEFPYEMIAQRASMDMIEQSDGCRILPVVPKIIIPLKNALATRRNPTMIFVMKFIRAMIAKEDKVGLALVPYYRQLLPIFNIFKSKNSCTGDGIIYGQRKEDCIGDEIDKTLQFMERHGGDDAFVNIKYMVPTYESCISTR